MVKLYIKSASSSLLSNKKVTIINIAGFSFEISVSQAIISMESGTGETGIRKVTGAGIPEVILALNKSFMIRILAAFITGLPAMYYSMDKWLKNFAYRTTLNWCIFVLSGLITFFKAIITVSWQSWKAATKNPVEALKYE